MPEITEIPFYMRCFVTCQIVLVVHQSKKMKRRGRKKKTSEVICHSMYIYIQERMCFHGPTLYKVFVHVFYISLRIRIMSVNKLDIEQGSQVR